MISSSLYRTNHASFFPALCEYLRTLLSAWATSQKSAQTAASALAWLSLDALDNDLIRFWSSVMAALRTCLPGIGEEALALLHARQSPPLPIILMTFLNELLAVGRDPIVISWTTSSRKSSHDCQSGFSTFCSRPRSYPA